MDFRANSNNFKVAPRDHRFYPNVYGDGIDLEEIKKEYTDVLYIFNRLRKSDGVTPFTLDFPRYYRWLTTAVANPYYLLTSPLLYDDFEDLLYATSSFTVPEGRPANASQSELPASRLIRIINDENDGDGVEE